MMHSQRDNVRIRQINFHPSMIPVNAAVGVMTHVTRLTIK